MRSALNHVERALKLIQSRLEDLLLRMLLAVLLNEFLRVAPTEYEEQKGNSRKYHVQEVRIELLIRRGLLLHVVVVGIQQARRLKFVVVHHPRYLLCDRYKLKRSCLAFWYRIVAN